MADVVGPLLQSATAQCLGPFETHQRGRAPMRQLTQLATLSRPSSTSRAPVSPSRHRSSPASASPCAGSADSQSRRQRGTFVRRRGTVQAGKTLCASGSDLSQVQIFKCDDFQVHSRDQIFQEIRFFKCIQEISMLAPFQPSTVSAGTLPEVQSGCFSSGPNFSK